MLIFGYLVLFFLCVLLTIIHPRSKILNRTFLFFFALIMILLASLQRELADRNVYLKLFEDICNENPVSVESSFSHIVHLVNIYSNNTIWLFLIYAILGISLKIIAIEKFAPFLWLSMLTYLSHFYILHDMIQIRAAVASGILLCLIEFLYKREWIKGGFAVCLANYFHRSSLVLWFLFFLKGNKINKFAYISMIPVCYIFYACGISLGWVAVRIPLDSVSLLFERYQSAMVLGQHTDINVFNAVHFVKCIFCIYLLYDSVFFAKKIKYFVLLIKIYTISLCAFVLLADIPVMAWRISEFLGIVEIFLIPLTAYWRHKFIGYGVAVAQCFLMLGMYGFYSELLISISQ